MLKVTFLGTGTSQGVPVIGCRCAVCTSADVRDNRLRTSVLLEYSGSEAADKCRFVIDTGPDFRQQMLRAGVRHLDAVVFTHQHKDHIAGLDDVRPFNYRSGNDMPIYATAAVEEALRREFAYAFGAVRYPGAPLLELRTISHQSPFEVCGRVLLQPIEAMHYLMPVLGFRHGDFTYLTDAKTIAETEFEKMRGTRVLVINALHHAPHISHFNLEEALAVIARLQPERAYLTHLSHHFGRHVDEQPRLPKGVYMAYDGLVLDDIA